MNNRRQKLANKLIEKIKEKISKLAQQIIDKQKKTDEKPKSSAN